MLKKEIYFFRIIHSRALLKGYHYLVFFPTKKKLSWVCVSAGDSTKRTWVRFGGRAGLRVVNFCCIHRTGHSISTTWVTKLSHLAWEIIPFRRLVYGVDNILSFSLPNRTIKIRSKRNLVSWYKWKSCGLTTRGLGRSINNRGLGRITNHKEVDTMGRTASHRGVGRTTIHREVGRITS